MKFDRFLFEKTYTRQIRANQRLLRNLLFKIEKSRKIEVSKIGNFNGNLKNWAENYNKNYRHERFNFEFLSN